MRSLILLVSSVFLVAMVAAPIVYAQTQGSQNQVTLGFDGVPDLSLNVDGFGVHFTGAQVLACGGSLNCPEFPPFSGSNVIFDDFSSGGIITATFDPQVTGKVIKVSARITGNRSGPNFTDANSGIPPNKLLQVSSSSAPIASVTFHDGGNTFTVDNFSFVAALQSVVIDPGHGQILENGVLTFQRPPSPTFGLIEDVLTLNMSRSLKANLEGANVTVALTRDSDLAPFAPPNCPVPCFADLNKRARWAEKQEPDFMISIHTNAGPPTANGSESFFSTVSPSPDSASLAQFVLDRVVGLGLLDRGVKQTNFNIINTSMPSTLIEVAFHTNSKLAAGQAITDEAQLNSSVFRSLAAQAIFEGIEDFYASK